MDRDDVGSHQRLVMGILIVTLRDDLGDDLTAAFPIGPEMREGGISAQHLAIMHAHNAAAERLVDAVFSLVKPIQQRKFPKPDKSLRGA